MTNTPSQDKSLLTLVRDMSQKQVLSEMVRLNSERIMDDPSQALLADQLKDISTFSGERHRQNIITISQFAPYVSLFDPELAAKAADKSMPAEDRRNRQRLFDHYVKNVINPQEITIILSDDKKWVVGVHDRIFRMIESADGSDETARINGEIIAHQNRKRSESAGRAMEDLGAQLALANDPSKDDELVKKIYLDSMLVAVIQDKLRKAIEDGKPGFLFDKNDTVSEPVAVEPEAHQEFTPNPQPQPVPVASLTSDEDIELL